MKDPALTQQDSLHDEVAYVLTTATLLKKVQAAVRADKDKRWQPSPSKRHKARSPYKFKKSYGGTPEPRTRAQDRVLQEP